MHPHQAVAAGGDDPWGAHAGASDIRAALYMSSADGVGDGSAHLVACARHAQQRGLRVVTMVAEDIDPATSGLDHELWVRRHDRRDVEVVNGLPESVKPLAPLVLALARLAAQRDARLILQSADPAQAA